MSITISITDPHLLPPEERRRLSEYFGGVPTVAASSEPERTMFVTRPAPYVPPGDPVVVPPSAAQTVPPTPPTLVQTPVPTAAIDSRGFPWDARIHSDNKSKNNDGTWRYRRGVKDDVIGPVEAELRGVMGMAQEAAPADSGVHHTAHTTVDPATAIPPAPAPAASDVPPPPPAAPAPDAPAEPNEPDAPTSAGSASGDDFNHLASIVTKAIAAKRLTQAQVAEVLGEVGWANDCVLPHMGALFTRKDLIGAVREKLQALIGGGV